MFRIFRLVKWSKHVVKCGQNRENITRKISIASALQPRLFLCLIVTLIRKLFKLFWDLIRLFSTTRWLKNYATLNKENGAPLLRPSSNIFVANGIFIRWRNITIVSCVAKIYTALNKEKWFRCCMEWIDKTNKKCYNKSAYYARI